MQKTLSCAFRRFYVAILPGQANEMSNEPNVEQPNDRRWGIFSEGGFTANAEALVASTALSNTLHAVSRRVHFVLISATLRESLSPSGRGGEGDSTHAA